MQSYDAIVIGAGHNGLAAAVVLAEAGWKVLVLEARSRPGGAIRTAEATLPGYRHDLYATNLSLFAASPFVKEYGTRLERFGLRFVRSEKPFCSVFPSGRFAGVSTDLERTVDSLSRFSRADGQTWRRFSAEFQRMAPHLLPFWNVPLPSRDMTRLMVQGRRALGNDWPTELLRMLLQSSREFLAERFESRQVRSLCAAWGMHLDFPPDLSGGALFSFVQTMACQSDGMMLGQGGASVMVEALAGLLKSLGGEVRCGRPATAIRIRQGRVHAVTTPDGETIGVRRAVVACLAPRLLYGTLVSWNDLPTGLQAKVERYRHGPGTMMIHLALSKPAGWRGGERVAGFAYVHVGPYMREMDAAYNQALDGLLPARPTLVVAQPTAVDPTRAPEGRHILGIQVRMVPSFIRGDALGRIQERDWATVKEMLADRVITQLEEFAPGLGDNILGRYVISPEDLERANPNLIGGDSLGGSHHLMQNYLLRPFPGWSRYSTPIDGLYQCGASTWPGAGVGASSGRLAARLLLKSSSPSTNGP